MNPSYSYQLSVLTSGSMFGRASMLPNRPNTSSNVAALILNITDLCVVLKCVVPMCRYSVRVTVRRDEADFIQPLTRTPTAPPKIDPAKIRDGGTKPWHAATSGLRRTRSDNSTSAFMRKNKNDDIRGCGGSAESRANGESSYEPHPAHPPLR